MYIDFLLLSNQIQDATSSYPTEKWLYWGKLSLKAHGGVNKQKLTWFSEFVIRRQR